MALSCDGWLSRTPIHSLAQLIGKAPGEGRRRGPTKARGRQAGARGWSQQVAWLQGGEAWQAIVNSRPHPLWTHLWEAPPYVMLS